MRLGWGRGRIQREMDCERSLLASICASLGQQEERAPIATRFKKEIRVSLLAALYEGRVIRTERTRASDWGREADSSLLIRNGCSRTPRRRLNPDQPSHP